MADAEGVLVHPTHPVCVVACMGEAYLCVYIQYSLDELVLILIEILIEVPQDNSWHV